MKKLILNLCVLAGLLSGAATEAADKAKVVFISGKPSHGRLSHEHRAGNMLLAKALNESGLPVEAVVLKDVGYPKDESVLEDAATIVLFCTGHGGHVHMNWQHDDNRKLMLNAILWMAKVKIPKAGVPSKTPTKEEMHANLD